MALFSRSKKEDATAAPTEQKVTAPAATGKQAHRTDRDLHSIIIDFRTAEKPVRLTERNVYTFNIRKDASKYDVRDAVKALFNVTPVKVNIVNKQPRTKVSRMRGRTSHIAGEKKAYVYLKDGETINLV